MNHSNIFADGFEGFLLSGQTQAVWFGALTVLGMVAVASAIVILSAAIAMAAVALTALARLSRRICFDEEPRPDHIAFFYLGAAGLELAVLYAAAGGDLVALGALLKSPLNAVVCLAVPIGIPLCARGLARRLRADKS